MYLGTVLVACCCSVVHTGNLYYSGTGTGCERVYGVPVVYIPKVPVYRTGTVVSTFPGDRTTFSAEDRLNGEIGGLFPGFGIV